MSIRIAEKQVSYDNPCAPLVKFVRTSSAAEFHENNSNSTDENDNDGMMDDRHSFHPSNYESPFNTTFGESLLKTKSLEDLVQSFDQTINASFADDEEEPPMFVSNEEIRPRNVSSNSWSELINSLRTSLRNDLKLPNIAEQCQNTLEKLPLTSRHQVDDDILSIDHTEPDEEGHEQLDMHSINFTNEHFQMEPFLTAEQVISEIDFMLQDMTPDSGYCDDQSNADPLDFTHPRFDLLTSNYHLKTATLDSLHQTIDDLNRSIKTLSGLLVQELADRDELDFEKETKNTFISLLFNIQNKREQYQSEKRSKRRSLLMNNGSVEAGTHLTTVIPYDPDHPTHLSVEYLQNLNKILRAIHDDSSQVPELLTNYILKVLCPC